jgi:L-ascorbate metabolism protein UlaG (beta-lactamase superfamily)
MMQRFPVFAMFFLATVLGWSVADAQQNPVRPQPSQCQAIAQSLPKATFASFSPPGPTLANDPVNGDVKITFLGHATLFIETPGGVSIATDYSGAYPPPYTPEVVTMNKAHPSHYTLTPDPAIKYVLHGWSDTPGEPARIRMTVGDTLIRNVASDIRSWGGGIQANGNSIFIFEVAGLCIGHLGHLHFELTDQQYAEIGRLDIVMVPVDGGLTMGADSMSRVVKRLRSSLILPMHRSGPPIDQFLALFGPDFDVGYAPTPSVTVSLKTLPRKPLIYVLKGL